ncbi:HIT family protein [Flavobacteriaceae bacterium]|nr:HIT family protein [Flavobacteriaceae bacterium]
MPSIFSKIIAGEIPSYKIAEDEFCYAFLDINPNSKGHTLCVSKREVDRLLDLSETEYTHLMNFSRKVGLAIEKAIPCERVGLTVIGLEVPHVHVHLIPLNSIAEATFQKKVTVDSTEMEKIAAAIRRFISQE